METRELYGGAIRASIPKQFLDISDIRPIPDHQEMFSEVETGLLFVFVCVCLCLFVCVCVCVLCCAVLCSVCVMFVFVFVFVSLCLSLSHHSPSSLPLLSPSLSLSSPLSPPSPLPDRSVIIELMSTPENFPLNSMATQHWAELANVNEAENVNFLKENTVLGAEELVGCGKMGGEGGEWKASWCVGKQVVSKYRGEAGKENVVMVYLLCLRLLKFETDLLVTLNDPVFIHEDSSSAGLLFFFFFFSSLPPLFPSFSSIFVIIYIIAPSLPSSLFLSFSLLSSSPLPPLLLSLDGLSCSIQTHKPIFSRENGVLHTHTYI